LTLTVYPARGHCNGTGYNRPLHRLAIHHGMHSMRRIFRQCPITSPHSTVTDRRRGVVPLDNLCLTDIDSPRSKCNAKPQSRDYRCSEVNVEFVLRQCRQAACLGRRRSCCRPSRYVDIALDDTHCSDFLNRKIHGVFAAPIHGHHESKTSKTSH